LCSINTAWHATVFIATKRMVGRVTASQIASASAASVFPRLTKGLHVEGRHQLAARYHHGAVSKKHLPAYLDEFVFRFNRRTAKNLSHRFARVIQHAVRTRPVTYHAIVAATVP
jgi:hypothetical protein